MHVDNHDVGYEMINQENLQKVDLDNDDQWCFSFAFQVLEYHPQPWNQWVTIGYIQQARYGHATLSIGPVQLPCLFSGESFKMEMI